MHFSYFCVLSYVDATLLFYFENLFKIFVQTCQLLCVFSWSFLRLAVRYVSTHIILKFKLFCHVGIIDSSCLFVFIPGFSIVYLDCICLSFLVYEVPSYIQFPLKEVWNIQAMSMICVSTNVSGHSVIDFQ